jgi:hypothetical protein
MKLTEEMIKAVFKKIVDLGIVFELGENPRHYSIVHEYPLPEGITNYDENTDSIIIDITKKQFLYILTNFDNSKEALAWGCGCTIKDIDGYIQWNHIEIWKCSATTRRGKPCKNLRCNRCSSDNDSLWFEEYLSYVNANSEQPKWCCHVHNK